MSGYYTPDSKLSPPVDHHASYASSIRSFHSLSPPSYQGTTTKSYITDPITLQIQDNLIILESTTDTTPVPSRATSTHSLPNLTTTRPHCCNTNAFTNKHNQVMYELSQAPFSGDGAAFAIQRIIYKSLIVNDTTVIKSRKDHIYDVKDISFTHEWMKSRSTMLVIPKGYGNECIPGPAVVQRGVTLTSKNRWVGKMNWHIRTTANTEGFVSMVKASGGVREFRSQSGEVIARAQDNVLHTLRSLDEKVLNALVTLWCAVVWYGCRKKRLRGNQKTYSNKFASMYKETKAERPTRSYNSNIPVILH